MFSERIKYLDAVESNREREKKFKERRVHSGKIIGLHSLKSTTGKFVFVELA
jgi:hypothetical protein